MLSTAVFSELDFNLFQSSIKSKLITTNSSSISPRSTLAVAFVYSGYICKAKEPHVCMSGFALRIALVYKNITLDHDYHLKQLFSTVDQIEFTVIIYRY